MPCDSTYTVRLKLDITSKQKPLLLQAFKRRGWTVLRDYSGGLVLSTDRGQLTIAPDGTSTLASRIRGQEGESLVEEINRMYSTECIYQQAEESGWELTRISDDEFEVTRSSGWGV